MSGGGLGVNSAATHNKYLSVPSDSSRPDKGRSKPYWLNSIANLPSLCILISNVAPGNASLIASDKAWESPISFMV